MFLHYQQIKIALNYYNYFTEIEETFIRRRGRNLLLSPLDWALIESWQEREIPLHIVVRGIEKVFDGYERQPNQRRTVKSLSFCRDEIETQYAAWREMQIGKEIQSSESGVQDSDNSASDELFSDEMIRAHLEKVFAELETAKSKNGGVLREKLETVYESLKKLQAKPFDAKVLEEKLEKMDAFIDDSLLKNVPSDEIKKQIEKQIASYKTKMDRQVYERTFNLMLTKRLREAAEIPRLSLFRI